MFDRKKFKSTKVDGILSVVYDDEEVFKNNTDLPIETLEQVSEYNSKYILEATEAATGYAKDKMKKEEDINKVTVKFPYSTNKNGSVDVVVDREKTFRNPQNGEDIVKPAISVKVTDPVAKVKKSIISGMVEDLAKSLNK